MSAKYEIVTIKPELVNQNLHKFKIANKNDYISEFSFVLNVIVIFDETPVKNAAKYSVNNIPMPNKNKDKTKCIRYTNAENTWITNLKTCSIPLKYSIIPKYKDIINSMEDIKQICITLSQTEVFIETLPLDLTIMSYNKLTPHMVCTQKTAGVMIYNKLLKNNTDLTWLNYFYDNIDCVFLLYLGKNWPLFSIIYDLDIFWTYIWVKTRIESIKFDRDIKYCYATIVNECIKQIIGKEIFCDDLCTGNIYINMYNSISNIIDKEVYNMSAEDNVIIAVRNSVKLFLGNLNISPKTIATKNANVDIKNIASTLINKIAFSVFDNTITLTTAYPDINSETNISYINNNQWNILIKAKCTNESIYNTTYLRLTNVNIDIEINKDIKKIKLSNIKSHIIYKKQLEQMHHMPAMSDKLYHKENINTAFVKLNGSTTQVKLNLHKFNKAIITGLSIKQNKLNDSINPNILYVTLLYNDIKIFDDLYLHLYDIDKIPIENVYVNPKSVFNLYLSTEAYSNLEAAFDIYLHMFYEI